MIISFSYGQMTFSDGWGKRSLKDSSNADGIKKDKENEGSELETYISNKCMLQYTNDINRLLALMTKSYSQYELCKQQQM
uniref:Uncharacterized protein n=1 Tax=Strongyloides venezuelensis TaxID=75913 RepID=A0A0K0F2P9_STRVS